MVKFDIGLIFAIILLNMFGVVMSYLSHIESFTFSFSFSKEQWFDSTLHVFEKYKVKA